MALKDLLKPLKGGDAATVASIERKISEAQELLMSCQKEANAAALEAEDGGDAAIKRAKQARAALIGAQDRLDTLAGALFEARERQQREEQADAQTVRVKGWKETERLANQRHKAAIELQVAVENIGAKYEELLELNAKQVAACPDIRGAKGGTAVPELLGAFRLYFVKQGMAWAQPDWVWGPDKIRPLAQIVEESNAVMLANQNKTEAA